MRTRMDNMGSAPIGLVELITGHGEQAYVVSSNGEKTFPLNEANSRESSIFSEYADLDSGKIVFKKDCTIFIMMTISTTNVGDEKPESFRLYLNARYKMQVSNTVSGKIATKNITLNIKNGDILEFRNYIERNYNKGYTHHTWAIGVFKNI